MAHNKLNRSKKLSKKTIVTDTPTSVLKSIDQMIGHFETEREELDKLIDDHIKAHKNLKENKALLESIPGVGKVIAQQMLMVLGSHQFESASQCAAYLGLVPVQKNRAAVSKAGRNWPKMGIQPSEPNSTWQRSLQHATTLILKARYERLTGKGKNKMSALGAAMRKLVQICFGVLKHQTTYQP